MKLTRTLLAFSIILVLLTQIQIGFGQKKKNFNDTTVLKKLKWVKLNDYVSYYLIDTGKKKSKSKSLTYKFKWVAGYQYYKKGYLEKMPDITTNGSSEDVSKLVLSDRFSHKRFDGLFKVNSKAAFVQDPGRVFGRLTVTPKMDNKESVMKLMEKLKKEGYVDGLKLDTPEISKSFAKMPSGHLSGVITVKIKPAYWSKGKISSILVRLKRWSDVYDVISAIDFFQGYNEQDVVYRITSL